MRKSIFQQIYVTGETPSSLSLILLPSLHITNTQLSGYASTVREPVLQVRPSSVKAHIMVKVASPPHFTKIPDFFCLWRKPLIVNNTCNWIYHWYRFRHTVHVTKGGNQEFHTSIGPSYPSQLLKEILDLSLYCHTSELKHLYVKKNTDLQIRHYISPYLDKKGSISDGEMRRKVCQKSVLTVWRWGDCQQI